jgi:hypothetical protein
MAAVAAFGCTALVGWIAHRPGARSGGRWPQFGLNPVV